MPEGVDLAVLSGWDIVVAEDAIESEVFAAEEFQRLYQRAGGDESDERFGWVHLTVFLAQISWWWHLPLPVRKFWW